MFFLELGYSALQQRQEKDAILYFLQAYNLSHNPEVALQLAYLYAGEKKEKTAVSFFLIASSSSNQHIAQLAAKAYLVVQQAINTPSNSFVKNAAPKSQVNNLLDEFYLLKRHHSKAAYQLIQRIINQYPDNLLALKEGGYLAIKLNYRNDAITYFTKAYYLAYEPEIALQLAYLYDLPNGRHALSTDKYWSYHFFNLATHTTNKQRELQAQNAMTNLSGQQTKVMPEPYFSEFFFDPFSQTRFGLTINPMVWRLGIEQDNQWQAKTYFVFRRTQDNKSRQAGQVPQIYEDGVQILGIGEQITPISSLPLVAFIEGGRAYDLFYRNRDRWRNDLRAGLMYYNEYGSRPAYFSHATANFNYYSTVYGDATYFSRYQNNVIANLKTHQGLRLMQYHSSMLNVYLTGRVIQDTNRDFYNNIAELGPGIGFIPSNRYKVELRFEHINGMYLPVKNSTNPYGKYYINNTIQLFLYIKL